jgi:CubicO group peptidase (beta-lactamase class C family)
MTVGSQNGFYQRLPVRPWRRMLSLLVVGVSACMGLPSLATEILPNASKQERIAVFRENVDKILHQLHTKQGPGLAVWVEFEGEVIYQNWGGLAHREQRIPIDGNTAFELASAAKPVTAALVMQLADIGMLKLDDSVLRWLPELPAAWETITLRHLLAQSAGVPDYMRQINASTLMELDGLTNDKLLQRWRSDPRLNFLPGTKTQYSNSNYVLLAEIIARACGTPYGQCMRQRMFEPLGMTHTRVETDESLSSETLALNYAATKRTKGIQLRTEGPTGIYSSLSDMALWLRAYQDGKIVSPASHARMTAPASTSPAFENGDMYGLGWVLSADKPTHGAYAHAGQKDGYRSLIRVNPHYRVNYILLSNGGDWVQPVTNEVHYWIQELFEGSF